MRRRLKRRSAAARKPGGVELIDPLSLSPVAWWDAADFTGSAWPDKIAAKSLNGTATISTDGSKAYPAVYLDGTNELVLAGTGTWDSVFGGSAAWEIVICFNPSPLSIDAEGILSAQRAGLTKPQLVGASLRGVALMRSATRAHNDSKEAVRRPRAATWEESVSGDGHHHYFATPIEESVTQITRHGRSGISSYASGYKAATFVLNGDNATHGGGAAFSVGGNSTGHYTGKISHIFCFDKKLTDDEAADLSAWIDAQVGATHLPEPVGPEVPATMMNLNFDRPNSVGINDGMVVDIDVGTAWDIGEGGFPRPPIGWEMFYAAQRPALATVGAHTGLRFDESVADYGFTISATTYTYPGSYTKYTSFFGPQEGMGYCVINFEQFATGGSSYTDWGTVFGWLSAPHSNKGLQYKKISGVTTVAFFEAETAVPENEICFVEFGLKTVSGNTVSHIRVNNGTVVKYTHSGLLNLSVGDVIGLGSRDFPVSAQHLLYRMRTCVDAHANDEQQKWRNEISADFGLTLATTDLFA